MAKLDDREALDTLRNSLQTQQKKDKKRLLSLCAGSGCGAYGTDKVYDALMAELAKHDLQDEVDVKL